MPEYIISNQEEFPKYARVVVNKSVVWTNSDGATVWPSKEKALLDFESTCHAMEVSVWAKLALAVKAGLIVDRISHSGHYGPRYAMGKKEAQSQLQLFATTWFIEEWLQVDADHKMEGYRIISRPAREDLLNVFDAYYVRNAQGRWLGGPKTKAHYQALAWHVNFGDAVSFLSEEAARAAVEANGPGAYNLMKTSCVFTEVLQGGPGGEPGVFVDQVAAGIAAACEARDIRASMNAEAEARSKASSDAAPRASSKRSNAL